MKVKSPPHPPPVEEAKVEEAQPMKEPVYGGIQDGVIWNCAYARHVAGTENLVVLVRGEEKKHLFH